MALPDELQLKYDGTWVDLTITLASLATDANLLVGRNSTAVDNTTNLYTDVRLTGRIETGTTPTANKRIEIWVYGEWLDADDYPDVLTGTDAGYTWTSVEMKHSGAALAAVMIVTADTGRQYPFDIGSVASLFGGFLPPKWGVFLVHDTAVNLDSTEANHQISYQGLNLKVID